MCSAFYESIKLGLTHAALLYHKLYEDYSETQK